MITYPRTDGRGIDPASARTAPHMGKNAADAPGPAVLALLLPPLYDRTVPEPGAVRFDGAVLWEPKPLIVPDGWVHPDRTVPPGAPEEYKPSCSFAGPPHATVLPAGTVVYRVIGRTDDGRLMNEVAGSWWMLEKPPPTEAEWRRRYAVCGHWNGDGGYIEYRLKRDVNAWVGETAAHRSMAPGHILPGGAVQAWVPRGAIDPIREGHRLEDILRPTPWRAGEVGLS